MSNPQKENWFSCPSLIIALGTCVVLLNTSCGYRPVRATVPGGYDRIAVPIVKNYTSYRGLAGPLTSAIRKRLAMAGVKVESDNLEGPRLEVSIILVENEPGMLTVTGNRLDAMDTIRTIHADVSVIDLKGQIVKGPQRFEVHGRAYSGGNPISDENFGRRRLKSLLDDLAENVVSHFLST